MTTSRLGVAAMLRSQSALGLKALITTASRPFFRYSMTSRMVWRRRPVRRPTWISSKNRCPSSRPHPQRYRYTGALKSRRSVPFNRVAAMGDPLRRKHAVAVPPIIDRSTSNGIYLDAAGYRVGDVFLGDNAGHVRRSRYAAAAHDERHYRLPPPDPPDHIEDDVVFAHDREIPAGDVAQLDDGLRSLRRTPQRRVDAQ